MRFTLLFFIYLFFSNFLISQIVSPCEVGKDRYICSDKIDLETKSTTPGKWRFKGPASGTFIDATNSKTSLSGITLPIVKVYWVNNDQSCADTLEIIRPKIGATSLVKNTQVVNSEEIKLCFGDDWKASTKVDEGKSFVTYILYKSKPPILPNVYADQEAFPGPVVFVNNDINDGSIKQSFPNTKNEYWFVPILYNEIGSQGPVIDQECQFTGKPFKITYLDKIEVTKKEDCMLGSVDLQVTGGTGNYDLKVYSPSSIIPDSNFLSIGKLNFSNILVKQIYSTQIKDDNQCENSFTTKFSPCPACKTDVIYQKTYCVYDSFPKPALKEGAGIGILELVPANETNLVFDSLTGAIDIKLSKPGKYVIRNKTSLSCQTQKYTDFDIEILDSIPLPMGKSVDTICVPNPKIGDIKGISAQLITWYNIAGDKLDPALDPAIHGNIYLSTQTIKGCESEKKAIKIFAPTVIPPVGDTIQYLCNNKVDFAGNLLYPQGQTIIWYDAEGKKIKPNDKISSGYYYAAQYLGCESKSKLKVQLLEKTTKIPVEVQDSFYFCKDQVHNVDQIVSKYKNVFLYDLPNSNVYLPKYQNLEQGLYYIIYKDSITNCSSERKKVWVNLPVLDFSVKIKEPYCGFENGEIEFINNNLFENISFFVNSIPQKSSVKNLNSGEYNVTLVESSKLKCKIDTIIKLQCKDSNLQEILTPNLDNHNDFLVLELNDAYPNLRLLIYNRWGNSVYESTIPYKDNWNGVDNSGNPLPSGTYYYVIEKERNQILKSGFIELVW